MSPGRPTKKRSLQRCCFSQPPKISPHVRALHLASFSSGYMDMYKTIIKHAGII